MSDLERNLWTLGKNLFFGAVLDSLVQDSDPEDVKQIQILRTKVRKNGDVAKEESINAISREFGFSEDEVRAAGKVVISLLSGGERKAEDVDIKVVEKPVDSNTASEQVPDEALT